MFGVDHRGTATGSSPCVVRRANPHLLPVAGAPPIPCVGVVVACFHRRACGADALRLIHRVINSGSPADTRPQQTPAPPPTSRPSTRPHAVPFHRNRPPAAGAGARDARGGSSAQPRKPTPPGRQRPCRRSRRIRVRRHVPTSCNEWGLRPYMGPEPPLSMRITRLGLATVGACRPSHRLRRPSRHVCRTSHTCQP